MDTEFRHRSSMEKVRCEDLKVDGIITVRLILGSWIVGWKVVVNHS